MFATKIVQTYKFKSLVDFPEIKMVKDAVIYNLKGIQLQNIFHVMH